MLRRDAVTWESEVSAAVGESLPGLVVTDIMMPVMGGVGLIRRLRSEPATAVIPILAASGDPHLAGEADAVLAKPYSWQCLLEVAEDLLRKEHDSRRHGFQPAVSGWTWCSAAAWSGTGGARAGAAAAALLLLIPASERGLRLFAISRGLEVVALVLFMHGAAIRLWNYALYSGAIAAGVLILVDLPQPSNYGAEGYRVLWTLCGLGIGVAVMLLASQLSRLTAKAPPQPA
jgi:CheY-like chemotaxis protein